MKFLLIHGRHDPDEDMQDWGFHGPVLFGVKYVHSAYGNLTVGFQSEKEADNARKLTGWPYFDEAVLEVRQYDDLIMIAPGTSIPEPPQYFGDWELVEDQDNVGGQAQ